VPWFLAILLACLASQAAAHRLEFVYVNANEGTASGGHAAIRFDDEVFHFQHVPSGLLRITRDNFRWFCNLYGLAENRTIFSHRIEVTDDTWTLLRDGFNRRLLIEDEQFDQLASLEQDRRLMSLHVSASAGSTASATIQLKGLGLFLEGGRQPGDTKYPSGPSSGSLLALRDTIERQRGSDFLPRLSRRLRQQIETLQPSGILPDPVALAEDRFVPAGYGYSERYADQLTALAALDVLQRGLNLRPGVLLRSDRRDFSLSGAELACLHGFRDRLKSSLVELSSGGNPGWGYQLLVGMARLIAIDTSLATGHLAVLDLGADDVDSPPEVGTRLVHSRFPDMAHEEFHHSKQALSRTVDFDERTYGRLERSANLSLRADGPPAAPQAHPVRLYPLPTRQAAVSLVAPSITHAELADHLAKLERAERAYHDHMARLYPYNLITNNCVSAIFRTVDRILGQATVTTGTQQADVALRNESSRRLGGYVDSAMPNSIPFLAFRAVGDAWRVVETREIPSWRRARLQEAYRRENPLLVSLAESNVLSSSLYRWHNGDAAFLFFSEDRPWLGPVTGTINAAVGLGQSLAGLVSFPWDHGHSLRQGAKGFLISLPELFFFNIRKGSYPEFSLYAAGFGLGFETDE